MVSLIRVVGYFDKSFFSTYGFSWSPAFPGVQRACEHGLQDMLLVIIHYVIGRFSGRDIAAVDAHSSLDASMQPSLEFSEPASMDYRILCSDHSLLHRLVLWSVCCCRRCSSFARRQHVASLESSEPASMDYRIFCSDHSLRYRSVLWSVYCCRRCSFFARRQHGSTTSAYSSGTRRNSRVRAQPGCATPSASA